MNKPGQPPIFADQQFFNYVFPDQSGSKLLIFWTDRFLSSKSAGIFTITYKERMPIIQ
jgi:hypothetical protein